MKHQTQFFNSIQVCVTNCSLSKPSPSPTSAAERPQAAHLLRSWVWIPPGAWIFVCCECRVLSGRGLCDDLITCPEESYRLCCVVVCSLETSRIGGPYIYIYIYDISNLRVKYRCLLPIPSTCPSYYYNVTFGHLDNSTALFALHQKFSVFRPSYLDSSVSRGEQHWLSSNS